MAPALMFSDALLKTPGAVLADEATRPPVPFAQEKVPQPGAPAPDLPAEARETLKKTFADVIRNLTIIAKGTKPGVKPTESVAAAKLLQGLWEREGLIPPAPTPEEAAAATAPPAPSAPGNMRLSRTITSVRKPPERASAPVVPLHAIHGGKDS